MAAAAEGHPEVVIQLIAANAKINDRDQYSHTALYIAVSKGQSECVSVLLKNGADPNSTDNVISIQLYMFSFRIDFLRFRKELTL